jgi:hypothetical protein
MRGLLLCKGPGAIKIKGREDLSSFNYIGWANLHNVENNLLDIPKRVDCLYILKSNFINQLDNSSKEKLSGLIIKNIKIVQPESTKKLLGINVSYVDKGQSICPIEKEWKDVSTGMRAFIDMLDNNEFEEFHVAGLDLLENGQQFYYFDPKDAIRIPIEHNKFSKMLKVDIDRHNPMSSLEMIYEKVLKYSNIKFVFYSGNEKFKDKFRDISNAIII